MKSRCRALVAKRAYSPGGRCEIRRKLLPIVLVQEGRGRRVLLCTAHRRVANDKRPLELAR